VLTANRGFDGWNQVFADVVVASAIVDRLLAKPPCSTCAFAATAWAATLPIRRSGKAW